MNDFGEFSNIDRVTDEWETLRNMVDDQNAEIERLRAELAQQWQPVEDEIYIRCVCGDPGCTSGLTVTGDELAAASDFAFVIVHLGEYRICKRVAQ